MTRLLFAHEHPVEGSVSLTLDETNRIVHLFCHWPFNLDDDQFVDIKNQYSFSLYRAAIDGAVIGRAARVPAVSIGFLEVTPSVNRFAIEFSNTGEGFMRRTLHLIIERPITSLLGDAS